MVAAGHLDLGRRRSEYTSRAATLVVTTWYAKDLGDGHRAAASTFVDLATRRYRHVLLVVPRLEDGELRVEPLKIHAGGVVWCGPWLHVAATARGLYTCHLDDLVRLPDGVRAPTTPASRSTRARCTASATGYLLPVRFAYRASHDEGHEQLRYSFLSFDRASTPPQLVAGEYARGRQTTAAGDATRSTPRPCCSRSTRTASPGR